jgi:hypothetical protein
MKFVFRTLIFAALAGACFGQTLSGTVTSNQTSNPIAGATVSAVGQPASIGQRPSAYTGQTDANGNFTISVPSGQYRICVFGVAGYVNPCRWGNAISAAGGASGLSIVLLEGAEFVLRIHDPSHFLQQAEAVPGTGVNALVGGAPAGALALPKIYDDGRIRDFGDLLPLNTSLTVSALSAHAVLATQSGAAPAVGGIPFQLTAAYFQFTPPTPVASVFFQPPEAEMIHLYVTGVQ